MKYNRDTMYGYQSLTSFQELFPTYEDWKTWLDKYLLKLKVEDTDPEIEQNIYLILYNRYKNQFFRYKEHSTILSKISARYLQLMRAMFVADYIGENLEQLAGSTVTTENFKTNNTADDSDAETNTEYRTDITRTFSDDGATVMDRMQSSIEMQSLVHEWMDEFKTMFVNQRKPMIFEVEW